MVGGRTYAEKVEGGTADDGGRSERAGVEARGDGLDHRQNDLWRRRAQGHEGEVRNRSIPDLEPGCQFGEGPTLVSSRLSQQESCSCFGTLDLVWSTQLAC